MEEISKSLQVVKTLKEVMSSAKHNIGHQYKDMNMTGPQGMLMGILSRYGEMKISDLSEKIGLSNSTVSGILDRLENQGLVERRRSKEDRRVVYVNITQEFIKIRGQQFKEIEKNIEIRMNKASSEELDKLLEGLYILKKILD